MVLVGAGRRKCPKKEYRSRISQRQGEGTLVPCDTMPTSCGEGPDGLDGRKLERL